jgi:Flp pilus assembly protein TadG
VEVVSVRNTKRFVANESGQVLILTAVCMVVIISFVGLVIDTGHLFYAERRLQTAAYAAALAAGLEIHVCGNLNPCLAMQTAVQSSLAESGYTGSTFLQNCATSTNALTITLNTPPCALGSADPNYAKKGYAEIVITQQVSNYFMWIVGFKSLRVKARSEATRALASSCIYALDPTASATFSISIALGINSQCGIEVESSSPAAFACLIGLGISAPYINVHGGAAGLLCPISQLKTSTQLPSPLDPLAYLPKPTIGACGSGVGNVYYGSSQAVNILLAGTYVFNPGVYCGGISMTAAVLANVTFNPGVYILTTGPGLLGVPSGGLNLTVSLLSNIQGQGVTFYNYGPFGSISITAPAALGLSNFTLIAPTSGIYGGVLFFQDPGNTSTGTFVASLIGAGKLEGAIYLPNASVSYGVSALSSAYTILVARSIQFNVSILSRFGNDYSSLDTGSPLLGNRASIIQ